jgi:hypothetical protein
MKNKKIAVLFVTSFVLISCKPPRYIYSPAPANNPYFRERGESKIAAYYSTSGSDNEQEKEYDNGLDLQAAYALSDHWALTADYYKRNEKQVEVDADEPFFQSATIRYNRKTTSFGTGYFTPLDKKKSIMFNVFTGIGFGQFSFDDYGLDYGTGYRRYYKNDVTKWYIQPSFNFFAGKYLRTGLIGKISWVHYSKMETNYTQPELDYLEMNLLSRRTFSFFEFTWNMQVTMEKMKWLHLDGGITLCTEAFRNYADLEARNFNASIGLSLDFSKMKNK